MSTNTIDAALCARMFLAGAARLEHKKEWINELNVFPVPDGDTGTNMTMTIMSAAKEVSALDHPSMAALAKAMSSGSLRGARGNSGVILSQLLRGFCKGIRDYEAVDVEIICSAFQKAVETAYKAVMKPKEGTILTVARGFAEEAASALEADPDIRMEDLLGRSFAHAEEVLSQTPEMLPVLKEAGVVDSGGQGLVEILRGAYDLFCGRETETIEEEAEPQTKEVPQGYCVEFILTGDTAGDAGKIAALRDSLKEHGEDVIVLAGGKGVKVHVIAPEPGCVITQAAAAGMLTDVRIEHMSLESGRSIISEEERELAAHSEEESAAENAERKPVGFVSVSVGEGLGSIFRDLGVDVLIEGGQTMNPSTEDVLNAIGRVNADTVFVFPNNKNIILAASQAQGMIKDRKVIVIPTKTIPQGIAALINYMPEKTPEENEQDMFSAISAVATCQITYAVRDTHIDDKTIHEGDFMGVGDHGILAVGSDLESTALEAVAAMVSDESELISIYYGEEITEDDAQKLADALSEQYPDCEVELNAGNQPIYYYIISVE